MSFYGGFEKFSARDMIEFVRAQFIRLVRQLGHMVTHGFGIVHGGLAHRHLHPTGERTIQSLAKFPRTALGLVP